MPRLSHVSRLVGPRRWLRKKARSVEHAGTPDAYPRRSIRRAGYAAVNQIMHPVPLHRMSQRRRGQGARSMLPRPDLSGQPSHSRH